MIEALIALAVFTIGIVAAFNYALANQESVRDNFDRYLAVNLAREGLEIVKNVRDSNWLKIDANVDCDDTVVDIQFCTWDQDLANGFYTVDYNARYIPVASNNISFFAEDKRLYLDNTDYGFYSHNDVGGQASNHFRTMEIKTICLDPSSGAETVEPGACGAGQEKIGRQAIAHVGWQRAGHSRQVEMVDNLYDWRR